MAIYTVHLPPGVPRAKAAADARFVKDGFSLWALLLPLPWLLVNRLWLATLAWLTAIVLLQVLTLGIGESAGGLLAVLFAIWFALEARDIQRWTLERNGWSLAAVVEERALERAERRFYDLWLAGRTFGPSEPPHAPPPLPSAMTPSATTPAVVTPGDRPPAGSDTAASEPAGPAAARPGWVPGPPPDRSTGVFPDAGGR